MKKIIIGCAVVASCFLEQAIAGPSEYVATPGVTYGEREIDFKMGSTTKPAQDRESAATLGFGYGFTQNWFSELYVKYKREGTAASFFDAYEWENKFQLTETGKYPVDVGFLLEIERPQDRAEGYEVKFGPLFQTEFGKTQLNANVLFQRNYRAAFSNQMQMAYQLQAKYRWHPKLEIGAQGFGDVGVWNNWAPRDQQSHRYGPAIFGKFDLGNRHAIKYNAAYLIDASAVTRSRTFRMQMEYEF